MNVSKPVAALIGAFTLWPVVYVFLFIAFTVRMVLTSPDNGGPRNDFTLFQYVMVLHLGTMLLCMILLAYYIVHVFKNPALTADNRPLWAVVLFMGNAIAMPIYWYLYVWRVPLSKSEEGKDHSSSYI